MLKVINLLLLIVLVVSGLFLVSQRFKTRVLYTNLNNLYKEQVVFNDEYTKLQLEYGTYTSDYVINQFSQKNVSLHQIKQQDVIYIKK